MRFTPILLLAAATLMAGPPAVGGNLVMNGGFEDTDAAGMPENWAGRAWSVNVTGEVTTVSGGMQGRCLSIHAGPGKTVYGAFSRAIDVSGLKAKSLLVSCSYRAEGDPMAQMMVVSYKDDFMKNQWQTRPMDAEARPLRAFSRWTTSAWHAELLPGANQVVLVFQLLTGGTLFVDNVSVRVHPGDVTLQSADVGRLASPPSTRRALLKLANGARAPLKGRLSLVMLTEEGDRRGPHEQDVELAGGQSEELDIRYDFEGSRAHTAQVTLTDRDNQEILLYREFAVPPMLDVTLVSPAFRATIMTSFDVPVVRVEGRLYAVPGIADRVKLQGRLVGTGATAEEGSGITRLPDGRFSMELPSEGMLIRDHEVQLQALEGDKIVAETSLPLKRAQPSGGEVTHDPSGRLIMNGRRVFPIGTYWVLGTQDLDKVQAAGFNTAVVPASKAYWVLAEAAAAKSMGIVVSSSEARREFWDLKQEKLGDHPALIGWETLQRPDAKIVLPDIMLGLYQMLAEVSPNHPVLTSLRYPDTMASYARATDIITVWDLPVPQLPITHLADLIDAAKAAVNGRKPVWAVVQATGQAWAVDKTMDETAEGRLPTVDEMRALAYLALVHGADGLLFHAYNLVQGPNERSYRIADDAPKLWAGVQSLNQELNEVTALACDPTFERIALPPAAEGLVHLARWRTQEADLLLAVNTSDAATITTITIPDCTATTLNRLFEEKAVESSKPGEFSVHLPPYASHVYSLR